MLIILSLRTANKFQFFESSSTVPFPHKFCLNKPLWLIQTELERDQEWDQGKMGCTIFMFDIHTATYVGTYTLALYSPGPGQARSE